VTKSAKLFTKPTLQPLPLELLRRRLKIAPKKSFWQKAAILFWSCITVLSGVIYEFLMNDIVAKTWKFEDYRVDHGALPPNSEIYAYDMTWETLACYVCLIIGTYTFYRVLKGLWKYVVIEITQTKGFES
jgi:hypothetical protein